MSRHGESLKYALNVLLSEQNRHLISKIYLYGSCARKQQKYTSDVDLFVLTTCRLTNQQVRALKRDVVPEDYTLPVVELKIGTSFPDSAQFRENIERDGKLIWQQ